MDNDYVRYCCYEICETSCWPDLIPLAMKDLDNPIMPYIPQGIPFDTIGNQAKRYLIRMEIEEDLLSLARLARPILDWIFPDCGNRLTKGYVDPNPIPVLPRVDD